MENRDDVAPVGQEPRKKRVIDTLTMTHNPAMERLVSQHPVDMEIAKVLTHPHSFDPTMAGDFLERIAEERKLNQDETELFHAFKTDFAREMIKAGEYGRRFVLALSLNWSMVDAPLVPHRSSGNLCAEVNFIKSPANLIRLGRVVHDFIYSCGFDVAIALQQDIIVDGRYIELEQLPASDGAVLLNYKAIIGQLYAVIPSYRLRFKTPLPIPPYTPEEAGEPGLH